MSSQMREDTNTNVTQMLELSDKEKIIAVILKYFYKELHACLEQ